MAGKKYHATGTGVPIKEVAASQTSAGAGNAGDIPALNASGVLDASIVNSVSTSAGAGDVGKLPSLDSTGKLDNSFMPSGVGAATAVVNCTENLAAGDFVDIYVSSGVKCRKADVSASGKIADGFVRAAFTTGNPATIYFGGSLNDQLTGLTPGLDYYCDPTTPGGVTSSAPSTGGQVLQKVGVAVSSTVIPVQFGPAILLA
jgi:hypothetical protein